MLNSTFANVSEHAAREDAPAREFRATVVVSDRVRPGVAASRKGFWPKRIAGASNANATVAERDADMGGGAVFHDNRVEVALSSRV